MNQSILVVKITAIDTHEKGHKVVLQIDSPMKKNDGYGCETDYLEIILPELLSKDAIKYLKVNATIGIKARLKSATIASHGDAIRTHQIIAEKLTFISLNK